MGKQLTFFFIDEKRYTDVHTYRYILQDNSDTVSYKLDTTQLTQCIVILISRRGLQVYINSINCSHIVAQKSL